MAIQIVRTDGGVRNPHSAHEVLVNAWPKSKSDEKWVHTELFGHTSMWQTVPNSPNVASQTSIFESVQLLLVGDTITV